MKHLWIIGLAGLTIAIFSANTIFNSSGQDSTARTDLLIRNIGHQLLLYAGDSSSRVLPVKEVRPGTFQLEFQNTFSFAPDSLVKIVRSNLKKRNLSQSYDVSVFNCYNRSLVYGFMVAEKGVNLIPCVGRIQPTGCYKIEIAFVPGSGGKNGVYLFLMTLTGISLIGFIGKSYLIVAKIPSPESGEASVKIGKYDYYPARKMLTCDNEPISLSEKEGAVFEILASRPNVLISREQLLKEVWEDQGVFTGRSLDMFISKLRKKLQHDPNVQIVNVHGKGYRLEIRK